MTNPLSDLSKETIRISKGTVLMNEGEIGQCAYFVVQGRLLVEKVTEEKRVILGEIGPRDIVGEMAILDDCPRSATVTALEDSLLIVLDKTRIRTIIRRSPEIAEVIMKLMCFKLRQNHELLSKTSRISSPDCWRKICTVLRLCAKADLEPEQRFLFFLENLQLFNIVAVSHLRDVIQRLKEACVIEVEGKAITRVENGLLELFILHSSEEFLNEELKNPTDAKLFEVMESIYTNYQMPLAKNGFVEVPYRELVDMMVAFGHWNVLHPLIQFARAKTAIEQLIQRGVISKSAESEEMVRIEQEGLTMLDKPEEDMVHYAKLKSVWLRP